MDNEEMGTMPTDSRKLISRQEEILSRDARIEIEKAVIEEFELVGRSRQRATI